MEELKEVPSSGKSSQKKKKIQKKTIQKETQEHYTNLRDLKIIAAIGESILWIPILWGFIVISTFWIALPLMFAFHVGVIVYLHKRPEATIPKLGNILGIVTSLVGFIPIVGMICHIITAVVLWLEVNKIEK